MSPRCTFCQHEIPTSEKTGRTEECPHCRRDLHCCLQCRFYDKTAHHECRETQAEYVQDKEKANFCDYFVFDPQIQKAKDADKKAQEAKSQLEALFRK